MESAKRLEKKSGGGEEGSRFLILKVGQQPKSEVLLIGPKGLLGWLYEKKRRVMTREAQSS